jgi:predicted dehydrogenase
MIVGHGKQNGERRTMLNVAFVGTGWWGKELAKAAQSLKESYTIAGCSALTAAERAEFCAAFDGIGYASYEAALADPAIDAVLLATPHSLHAPQIIAAAQAGKHVFVEKPLALSAASADRAIAACATASVVLAVGHNRRYSAVAREMKSLLDAGACGKVLHVEANYSSAGALQLKPEQWRAQREEAPCGGIAPMAMHLIDTFTWLLGPVARIAAIAKRQVVSVAIDDTCASLFELESGATGTLSSIFVVPYTAYLTIYGTRAIIEARKNFSELTITPLSPDEPTVHKRFTGDDTVKSELAAFAASCADGAEFPVRPAQARHNVAIMEAIASSASRDGAWVALSAAG